MQEKKIAIDKRVRQILAGKVARLPGLNLGSADDGAEIYDPIATAINRAYAQGWAEAEADMVGWLDILSIIGEDTSAHAELWGMAHKAPRDEVGLGFRRDWFEYDYARQVLKLAGIDPFGKRPKFASDKPVSAKKKKAAKKRKK